MVVYFFYSSRNEKFVISHNHFHSTRIDGSDVYMKNEEKPTKYKEYERWRWRWRCRFTKSNNIMGTMKD